MADERLDNTLAGTDEAGKEGLGALLFLVVAVCISLVTLIVITVVCQGPTLDPPF